MPEGHPETLRHWAYQCEGDKALEGMGEHGGVLLRVGAQWDGAGRTQIAAAIVITRTR